MTCFNSAEDSCFARFSSAYQKAYASNDCVVKLLRNFCG